MLDRNSVSLFMRPRLGQFRNFQSWQSCQLLLDKPRMAFYFLTGGTAISIGRKEGNDAFTQELSALFALNGWTQRWMGSYYNNNNTNLCILLSCNIVCYMLCCSWRELLRDENYHIWKLHGVLYVNLHFCLIIRCPKNVSDKCAANIRCCLLMIWVAFTHNILCIGSF